MASWVFEVSDIGTGKPVSNAYVNVTVNTNPCPPWPDGAGCTTGNGYSIQGYTDGTGKFTATIQWTCRQDLIGTVTAGGYDSYPFEQNSGAITGDVYFTVQLTSSAPSSSQPLGVFSAPPGQGLSDTTGLAQWWSDLTSSTSSTESSLAGQAQTGGIILAVIIGLVVIGLIAVAFVLA
jgi:hypothetical protein